MIFLTIINTCLILIILHRQSKHNQTLNQISKYFKEKNKYLKEISKKS
jgi:hypothetical protein